MTIMTEPKTHEVRVECLLLYGKPGEERAMLQIPGQDEPAWWPAAQVAAEAGVPVRNLPGRELAVQLAETLEEGRTFTGFRLVPRTPDPEPRPPRGSRRRPGRCGHRTA